MLKQRLDGSFVVKSKKEMKEAIALMREKSEMVAEIEAEMEEEYGLIQMRKDSINLKTAVDLFLIERDEGYEDDKSLFTIVRPKRWRWNADKLKKLIPSKSLFMSVCDYSPNSDKIDEAVATGKLKRNDIEAAFEAEPTKAYIKHSVKSKRDGQEEADRIEAQLA